MNRITHSSTRRRRMAAAALVAVAIPAGAALAAKAGDLDPVFGEAGKKTLSLDMRPGVVLAQPDGKVILADQERFRLVRLSADASIDRDFGVDGVASADPGSGSAIESAALQPDGKIVAVGTGAGGLTVVARFLPDGKLDPEFDPGGPEGPGLKLGGLMTATAEAVVVQPDNRIVLAGAIGGGVSATRLKPDGALAETQYEQTPSSFRGFAINGAALGPAGELVVMGDTQHPTGDFDPAAARFTAAGKLDTTFGGDGQIEVGPSDRNDIARAVMVQPDGKTVLVGESGPAGERVVAATRINADGTLDGTFGLGGRAVPDLVGKESFAAAALQPDGKLLLAGTADLEFALVRLDTGGRLDRQFGTDGTVLIPFADIAQSTGGALHPNGAFVLAGVTAVDNRTKVRTAVARVLGDPPPQPTPTPTATATASPEPSATASATPSPTATATPTTTPVGDTQPPVLGGLKVVKPRAGTRAKVRFEVSESGTVAIALARRKGRTARTTRLVRQGSNRLQVGRKLTAGRYRLVAAPIDAAGNAGVARRVRFAVR